MPLLIGLSTYNTCENCELTKNSHLLAINPQKIFRIQLRFDVFHFHSMVFARLPWPWSEIGKFCPLPEPIRLEDSRDTARSRTEEKINRGCYVVARKYDIYLGLLGLLLDFRSRGLPQGNCTRAVSVFHFTEQTVFVSTYTLFDTFSEFWTSVWRIWHIGYLVILWSSLIFISWVQRNSQKYFFNTRR